MARRRRPARSVSARSFSRWPLPRFSFVLFLNINNSFKCFNQIKLLTQGGPANSTKTLIYYIYENAIVNGRFETACVQAIFLFLMIFILTRIQFALEDKVVHYQ